MTDPDFLYDVFLSFASADETAVREVYQALSAGGLRVFWSSRTLGEVLGQDWFEKLQESLERSRHLVVYWTAHAKHSKWVGKEYGTFYTNFHIHEPGERRLVFLLDPVEAISSLPLFVRNLQSTRSAADVVDRLGGRGSAPPKGSGAASRASRPVEAPTAPAVLGSHTVAPPPPILAPPPTVARPDWASAFGHDRFGTFATFRVGKAEQTMRWMEPGTFQMGSPADEPGRYERETLHGVTLTRGFWLADTACPQDVWVEVMGGNPSWFKSPDRPVEQVSWEDCQTYCRRLGERLGGPGWRLPTEAEWEYACRAGTVTATYAGAMEIRGENDAPVLDAIAWYAGNSGVDYDLGEAADSSSWKAKQFPHTRAGTRRAKAKAPSPWGVYDTLGNVWEWCEDWYGPYGSHPVTDPTGPSKGTSRVFRGGSWGSAARRVRAAFRGRRAPSDRWNALGFRLARGQGLRSSQ